MTLPDHVRKLLEPKQTAVLVIDVQRAYCDENETLARMLNLNMTPVREVVPYIGEFVREARQYVPIVWTRTVEDPDLSPGNIATKMRAEGTPAISTPGKPSFEYYEIKPEQNDKEIIKDSYGTFESREFQKYLQNSGIRTLVFTGFWRSRCVKNTMGDALDRGYHVVHAQDLTANPIDPKGEFEIESEATLSIVNHILGYNVNSQDILNAWASYKK